MLVPNETYELAVEEARDIESWLDAEGVDVFYAPHFGFDGGVDFDGLELVVSFGGDGTLLRAAHLVGSHEVPILGLSFGHLGFLTFDGATDSRSAVAAALAGELHESRRSVLKVNLAGRDAEGRPCEDESFAINELVLARGASGKMVEFDVSANGVHVDRLRGDGFVVSTATGSTGYALSAGGPIVSPDYRGLVCVPIAPHTITARAFLTASSDVVELKVADDRSFDPCVFSDGEPLCPGIVPETLRVCRASHDVVLLTGGSDDFFASVSRVFYGKVR